MPTTTEWRVRLMDRYGEERVLVQSEDRLLVAKTFAHALTMAEGDQVSLERREVAPWKDAEREVADG